MALPHKSLGNVQLDHTFHESSDQMAGAAEESSEPELRFRSEPAVIHKPEATLETMPLEIKHEIFSYLLKGSNVKSQRPKVNRPEVHFAWEKSILRVNKSLGEQAKAYLYSANTFIYVEYFWTAFLEMPLNAGIPVVAELDHKQHELTFHHHSMHVYFQHGENLTEGLASHMIRTGVVSRPGVKEIPLGALIILWEDLEALCRTIQYHHHLRVGHNVVITSSPETTPITFKLNVGQLFCVIEVTLCQPAYSPSLTKPEKIIRQKKMLKPLRHLSTSMQTVVVKDAAGEGIERALVKAITPRVAWLDASGWTLYERMLEAKVVIDSMTELQQYPIVLSYTQYQNCATRGHMDNFLFKMDRTGSFLALEFLPKTQEAVERSWQLGVFALAIECHVSQALIALKHGMTEVGESIGAGGDAVITIMEQYNLTESATKAATLLTMNKKIEKAIPAELAALVHHLVAISLAADDDGPLGSIETMRELRLASQAFPAGKANVLADMAVVQACITSRGRTPGLDRDNTSLKGRSVVCRFPLDLERPARYHGFCDVEHKLEASVEKDLIDIAVRSVDAEKQWKKDFFATLQRRET